MQYIYRFNIKDGQSDAFVQWLGEKDADLHEHISEGWEFVGVYFTVRGFGRFDAEYRANVTDYAALGSPMDEQTGALINEMFARFVDRSRPLEAQLVKSHQDVQILVA